MKKLFSLTFPFTLFVLAFFQIAMADDEPLRARTYKLFSEGNYKEAFEGYQKIIFNQKSNRTKLFTDLSNTLQCLRRLNRIKEIDALLEKVVNKRSSQWQALYAGSRLYRNLPHYGYMISGEFQRGDHRGSAKYANSFKRDRARGLQLLEEALFSARKREEDKSNPQLYFDFAAVLMQAGGAWKLQYLTDLENLPDFDEGGHFYHGSGGSGAPVDEKGDPIYYSVPTSYQKAENDGERWRWLLSEVGKLPGRWGRANFETAKFFHSQFGVRTLAQQMHLFAQEEEEESAQTKIYSLKTLSEGETIARLANGIKRFKLPKEFDFIGIYRRLAEEGDSFGRYDERALTELAGIFEDRRQYPEAAKLWQENILRFSKTSSKQRRLDQIVGAWGRFEELKKQPSGRKAKLEYRFRNGRSVHFTAQAIDIPKLIEDAKAYLRSDPAKDNYEEYNLDRIGFRLVNKNQKQYLKGQVADWTEKLSPLPNHFDSRMTVKTPLIEPGAYLITAKMAGGNTSKIILWINDTVILRKQFFKKYFYYLADAETGSPLSDVSLEFFGFRRERIRDRSLTQKLLGRSSNIIIKEFSRETNHAGQAVVGEHDLEQRHRWLVVAKKNGRYIGHLGYSHVWYSHQQPSRYREHKPFIITDRPVYRPGQPVKFKAWLRQAHYDLPDVSTYAGQTLIIEGFNPKREKIFTKSLRADQYGGVSGEIELKKDAALGQYRLEIAGWRRGNVGNFRVEEYKKPEYEVKVEAPSEPVMLGEKIKATISARYYFGAPVTDAKVKYKVLRNNHYASWYPAGRWDWLYGRGYWWFASNYDWYPGWARWSCEAPYPFWIPRPNLPPEVVQENEVSIGEDGTVEVTIDTTIAKELYGNTDHRYTISAEVVDESRRMIVGEGAVLAARRPFKVYTWLNRGYYFKGDTIEASFSAQTLDQKPIQGKGKARLLQISYDKKLQPSETEIRSWSISTDVEGKASLKMKAAKPGQYKLIFELRDKKGRREEGGYIFMVHGRGFNGEDFRFNDLELMPQKKEYTPGENMSLMVNSNQAGGTVLLFVRPENGRYNEPKLIQLDGKSLLERVQILKQDMPNFFVEAVTIHGGKIHTVIREIVVPPEKRILNVEVEPASSEYQPGAEAKVKVKVTDQESKPFRGSLVISAYDKSVEYISSGSNVPDIRTHFWKWRRSHRKDEHHNIGAGTWNINPPDQTAMQNVGVFGEVTGHSVVEKEDMSFEGGIGGAVPMVARSMKGKSFSKMTLSEPMSVADGMDFDEERKSEAAPRKAPAPKVQPKVRKEFADTAFWSGILETNRKGEASVKFTLPENLTEWKIAAWALGHGTKVGQGESKVVTTKNLLLRMQAPRFFVEKDEVVLSANVHNYLKDKKQVEVRLELASDSLSFDGKAKKSISIPPKGEKRVDWRVKVVKEGEAVIRMLALTDQESDAMEMRFPVYVHGMLKTDSFSGVVRPEESSGSIVVSVPKERRPEQSRLEVRYSPTLAGAMVDALPYLVSYPYGCTEQTLSRFLPTVMTQRILQRMNVNLAEVKRKQTNLNAQEIGDGAKRAKGWKRWRHNPVFDEDQVNEFVRAGLFKLANMQNPDGGWGWFSGSGESSYPHTTAYVIHGLQIAREQGLNLPGSALERGISWLERYQAEQLQMIKNAPTKTKPWKKYAGNLDAFVYMVLADSGKTDVEMREFLYRDRNHLAVYAKAMFGLAMYREERSEKVKMLLRNIEQNLVQDDENQTAYLNLNNGGYWWYWYGSEYEAHAYYLKLLSRVDPKSKKASGLVKYLLNNRKNATYWKSTRDTAVVIEAFADYLQATGEMHPDLTLEILIDGKVHKNVRITGENLFTFDNVLMLESDEISSGSHKVELRKKGRGPIYFNAYLSNFTLEDYIKKAGLEIKVNRKYYKLERLDKKVQARGSRGQALTYKAEKYKRHTISNLDLLKSGDMVEIELEIESKNDYEYLIFEDMKPAGFEPLEVRSGYNGNEIGAYVEFRDNRVVFFARTIARGKHSVSYRMRAEIPGKFSALPTRASAMYAPELRANSDEIKIRVED